MAKEIVNQEDINTPEEKPSLFGIKKVVLKNRGSKNKVINILLQEKSVAILPTDTVYGMFATISSENIKLINDIKDREENKDISVMFSSLEQAHEYIENTNEMWELLKSNLPGKKTFIVKLKKGKIPAFDEINKTEMGIRVIANDRIVMKAILNKTGPLLSTSCNKTGEEPIWDTKSMKEKFKDNPEIKIFAVSSMVDKLNKATKIFDISDGKTIKVVR